MEVKRRTAKTLISKLSSVSEQTRTSALCELRLLSKNDPEIRPIIADEGAIPYIAETLYSPEPLAQENAAATLLNISISDRDSLMSTRGLLDALSHVLSHHRHHRYDPAAVQSAAATIYSLSIDETYRPIIGSKRDIVYALIDIIKDPESPARSIKDSLKALFGLALCPQNRPTVVEFGAVGALFGLVVKDGRVGVVEDATAVISQIAGCEESIETFRRVSGVRVLLDLVDPATGASARIKENAVSGLLNLVQCGGEKVEEEIREVGLGLVFEGLEEVAYNGSPKGKAKAAALMKILGGGGSMNKLNGGSSEKHSSDSCSGSGLDSGPYSY